MGDSSPYFTGDSAQEFIAGLVQLKMEAKAVDNAFLGIHIELLRILATVEPKRDVLKNTIRGMEETWRKYHEAYRSLFMLSRENAGAAQARLSDFVMYSFPQLLASESEVSFQQKKDLMALEMQAIHQQEETATRMSMSFKKLVEEVDKTVQIWSDLATKELSGKGKRLKRMLSELLQDLGSMPDPSARANSIPFPVKFWLFVRRRKASAGELSGRSSHGTAVTLLNKLGTLCNIWAVMRSDLQHSTEYLQIQKDQTGIDAFRARTEGNRLRYLKLIEALRQYQLEVGDDD